MKTIKVKVLKKTDEELEEEMRKLILGKHRLGSKDWVLQKSLHAIKVQQNISVDDLVKFAVEQHKKNHSDLYSGKKQVSDIAREARENIGKAKSEGLF